MPGNQKIEKVAKVQLLLVETTKSPLKQSKTKLNNRNKKQNILGVVPLAIAPVLAAAAMTDEGALMVSSLFPAAAGPFPPFRFFDFQA